MMEPELVRVLHDFDFRSPWIFDEREFEEPWHITNGLHDLDALGLKDLHGTIEIRHRESDVIDDAAFAGQTGRPALKHDSRITVQQAILRLFHRLAAEVFAVPRDGFLRFG